MTKQLRKNGNLYLFESQNKCYIVRIVEGIAYSGLSRDAMKIDKEAVGWSYGDGYCIPWEKIEGEITHELLEKVAIGKSKSYANKLFREKVR